MHLYVLCLCPLRPVVFMSSPSCTYALSIMYFTPLRTVLWPLLPVLMSSPAISVLCLWPLRPDLCSLHSVLNPLPYCAYGLSVLYLCLLHFVLNPSPSCVYVLSVLYLCRLRRVLMSSTSCAYVLSVLYLCRFRPVLMLMSSPSCAYVLSVLYLCRLRPVLMSFAFVVIFGIYHFGLNLVAPASLASPATGPAVAREAGCSSHAVVRD